MSAVSTKRKRKPKLLRDGPMAQMYAEMDRVYNGALEVIKRHPVTAIADTGVVSSTPYRKAKSPRLAVEANPEIVEYAQKHRSTMKTTALIRAVAASFPATSVAEIRASLPELNPSTVGIQVGKARRK